MNSRLRGVLVHLGLLAMVIVYNVIGTFIFQVLEKKSEETRIKDLLDADEYYKATLSLTKRKFIMWRSVEEADSERGFRRILGQYQEQVKFLTKELNYPGNANDSGDKWSIASAFLFCVSSLTLIGFGHVAPKSSFGQAFFIPWSIFGIVLTSLYLAVVANLIIQFWNALYRRLCYPCTKKRTITHETRNLDRPLEEDNTGQIRKGKLPASFSLLFVCIYLGLGAVLYHLTEDWLWSEAMYFVVVTLATVGFGDYVPGWTETDSWPGKISLMVSLLYMIFGMGVVAAFFATVIDALRRTADAIEDTLEEVGEDLGIFDDQNEEDNVAGTKFGRTVKF